jgi:hypothetical protein
LASEIQPGEAPAGANGLATINYTIILDVLTGEKENVARPEAAANFAGSGALFLTGLKCAVGLVLFNDFAPMPRGVPKNYSGL